VNWDYVVGLAIGAALVVAAILGMFVGYNLVPK